MAKEFKKDLEKLQEMNLDEAEQAFYDALANNESAENLMGEDILMEIAREVAQKLRDNVTIDWSVRESVRAKIRIMVKTLLKRYKYPPDEQEEAVDLILRQAEVVSEELVA